MLRLANTTITLTWCPSINFTVLLYKNPAFQDNRHTSAIPDVCKRIRLYVTNHFTTP